MQHATHVRVKVKGKRECNRVCACGSRLCVCVVPRTGKPWRGMWTDNYGDWSGSQRSRWMVVPSGQCLLVGCLLLLWAPSFSEGLEFGLDPSHNPLYLSWIHLTKILSNHSRSSRLNFRLTQSHSPTSIPTVLILCFSFTYFCVLNRTRFTFFFFPSPYCPFYHSRDVTSPQHVYNDSYPLYEKKGNMKFFLLIKIFYEILSQIFQYVY